MNIRSQKSIATATFAVALGALAMSQGCSPAPSAIGTGGTVAAGGTPRGTGGVSPATGGTVSASGGSNAGTGGFVASGGSGGVGPAAFDAIYVSQDGSDNGFPNSGGADETMTRAIMADIEARLCVDRARYSATGFSYGGSMSYTAACT